MAKKRSPPPPPLRLEWLDPAELATNPRNWRLHPDTQRRALNDVIGEVGWAGALLFNERTQRLIDGHARKDLFAGKTKVPVLIGSWTEDQEKKILATLDPLTSLAQASSQALTSLLAEVTTDSDDLTALLTTLAGGAPDAKAKPTPDKIDLEYSVLIKCPTEQDQLVVLKELDRHGLDARAIIAGFADPKPIERPDDTPIAVAGRQIKRTVQIDRTPRVRQLEGMFDVPPAKRQDRTWTVNLTLDRPWHIGLIVGPSGSGKTTIARDLFPDHLITTWPWPEKQSVLDGFPASMPVTDIVALLSSVGFNSPPSWLKPFGILSNGEQFRVNLARTLAEAPDLAVIDEFTSVVDRTVAQIGSAALAKTVRATNRRIIAVSCHYDIEEWLQPDWKLDLSANCDFAWRSLQRRPQIELRIRRVDTSRWAIFRDHHYLDHDLHRAARCFMAEVAGRPAAFASVLHNPHAKTGGWWREHRTVCLPDFQGVGIGNALSEFVAGLFLPTGKQYRSTTTHPAMIRHRLHSPLWEMIRAPALSAPAGPNAVQGVTIAYDRPTAGFRYVGPARPDEARAFGLLKS